MLEEEENRWKLKQLIERLLVNYFQWLFILVKLILELTAQPSKFCVTLFN